MYSLFALLSGAVIALSTVCNGLLTEGAGVWSAAVLIHVVGLLFSLLLLALRGQRPLELPRLPLWMYLGGVIGVATTVFYNRAFHSLSVTAIVALALFGQMAASLVIDLFGLFGAEKRPFHSSTLLALLFALAGIVWMSAGAGGKVISGMALSMGAGVTSALSQLVNARLAQHTGALRGSFLNHLAGLPVTVLLLCVFHRGVLLIPLDITPFAYLGGVCGVVMVLLFNLTILKVPVLQTTMFSFAGQLFTGIALDLILAREVSPATTWGGALIVTGLLLSKALERRTPRSKAQIA